MQNNHEETQNNHKRIQNNHEQTETIIKRHKQPQEVKYNHKETQNTHTLRLRLLAVVLFSPDRLFLCEGCRPFTCMYPVCVTFMYLYLCSKFVRYDTCNNQYVCLAFLYHT